MHKISDILAYFYALDTFIEIIHVVLPGSAAPVDITVAK